MIIYGMLSPNYQPPPLPEGECAYLLRELRNEEFFENDCNMIIVPEYEFGDKNSKDLRDIGNGSLNLEFTSMKNKALHEMIKEVCSRKIDRRKRDDRGFF